MHVQIIEFPRTRIAVLEHRGSPASLNDSVSLFIEWRKKSGLSPVGTSKTYGIAYDDPAVTEPDKFRFDLCGSLDAEVPTNSQGVINSIIPAGRCAMIRHQGAREELDDKVRALYREWLPASGEELRDFPCYFEYINFFPEVAEHELITCIYLPLA